MCIHSSSGEGDGEGGFLKQFATTINDFLIFPPSFVVFSHLKGLD